MSYIYVIHMQQKRWSKLFSEAFLFSQKSVVSSTGTIGNEYNRGYTPVLLIFETAIAGLPHIQNFDQIYIIMFELSIKKSTKPMETRSTFYEKLQKLASRQLNSEN